MILSGGLEATTSFTPATSTWDSTSFLWRSARDRLIALAILEESDPVLCSPCCFGARCNAHKSANGISMRAPVIAMMALPAAHAN